jgi:hypothetical protein
MFVFLISIGFLSFTVAAVLYPAFSPKFLRLYFLQEDYLVKVIPQRTVQGIDTKHHGIRLDAFIEDVSRDEIMGEMEMLDVQVVHEKSDIYDIDPNKIHEKERLSRKIRYYHGLIDTKLLRTSVSYEKLPNVFIIMILSDEPFGKK